MSCIFENCNNSKHLCKGTEIRFFHLPKIPYMRQKWLESCNRFEKDLPKFPFVCSIHFNQKDIMLDKHNRWLNKNAVPVSFRNQSEIGESVVDIENTNYIVNDGCRIYIYIFRGAYVYFRYFENKSGISRNIVEENKESDNFFSNIPTLNEIEFDGLENFAGYLIYKMGLKQLGQRTHEEGDTRYTYVNCLSEGGLFKPSEQFLKILEHLNSLFVKSNDNSLNTQPKYLQNVLYCSKFILEEKVAKRFFLGRTYFRIRFLNRRLGENKIFNSKKKLKTL